MTTNFQFGLSGAGPQLQLGKDGNIIASNSGILSMYLSDGATYATLRSAYPSGANDVATLQYVTDNLQGLTVKASVACATNSNITLSGLQTIDGYSVQNGDRVLVKNQSTASQNGIYIASSSAWARSTDTSTGADLLSAFTFVENGSTHAASGWVVATPPPIIIGVTSISWSQFSSSGSYTAGSGLTLTGNQFSANVSGASTGIVGNNIVVLSSGTSGQLLISSSSSTAEATWGALDLTNSNSVSGSLPVTHGGTGVDAITNNGVMFGQGFGAINATTAGTNGQILQAGSGGIPLFAALNLATSASITGLLPMANGGTGVNNTANAGAIAYSNSTGITLSAVGASGTVLQSNGTSAPSWLTLATVATSGSASSITIGTLGSAYGGTGVNNGSNTLTLGGSVTYSGAHTVTWTTTGTTAVTLPTSGTLLSTAAVITTAQGGTGLNLGASAAGQVLYTANVGVIGTTGISTFGISLIAATALPSVGTAGQIVYNGASSLTSSSAITVDSNSNVIVGTGSLSTSATNGFLYLPTMAGTPTGTPTSYSGRTPIIIDTSNNSLYFYNSGWQQVSGGSGAVSSVSNSDSSLTVTPTTGAVVASLNLAHTNTWTAQQNFANITVPASNWIYFNTTTDTNWRMGLINAFTTSHVGAATSIQIVTGTGTGGPDGFAIGQTGGASIFEIVGNTKAAYFLGALSVAGNASASSFTPTSSSIPTNGLYLPSSNTIALATNGILAMTINTSQKTIFSGAVQINTLNSVGVVQTDSSGNLTTAALTSANLPFTVADMSTYSMYGGF